MLAIPCPILETHREFVGAVAWRHPLVLRQTEIVEEEFDGAKRRLPYADRPDVRRFDQCHVLEVRQRRLQITRGHPPCGSTSDDHHFAALLGPWKPGIFRA